MLVGKARQRARGAGDNLSLALVRVEAARLSEPRAAALPGAGGGSGRAAPALFRLRLALGMRRSTSCAASCASRGARLVGRAVARLGLLRALAARRGPPWRRAGAGAAATLSRRA